MKLVTLASALSTVMSLSVLSTTAAPPNQPPLACFTADPGSGYLSTVFQLDASCSTDDKTQPSKLKVRWDWETDGTWDTAFTTVKTASHQYGIQGPKPITLQVQDGQGLLGTNTGTVSVLPADTVRVGLGMTEPDIEVNPLNPAHIVFRPIMSNVLTGGIVPYPSLYSMDGGANWTRATGPGPYQVTDPVVSFDRLGAVYFGGLSPGEFGPSIHRGVIVARSTDGGATFATPVYAMSGSTVFTFPDGSTGRPCGTGTYFDYEKMEVDKSAVSPYQNSIYLTVAALNLDVTNDGVCDTSARVFVRSTDGGVTWDAAQALPQSGTFVHNVAVGRDGAIYLSWGGSAGTGPCASGSGVVFRVSRNGGTSFDPPVCAYNADGSLGGFATYTATDPNDAQRIWIAFSTRVAALDNTQHVYVIASTDGGASWSAPRRIDEILPDDLVDHVLPSLSASSSGRLDLVWIDYRNSTSKRLIQNRQTADLFYTSSTDGGTTWATSRPLSVTSPFLMGPGNDFVTVTSSGNKAYAAYSVDFDRDGLWEGFVTTITFP
jgi:hypothetical protein